MALKIRDAARGLVALALGLWLSGAGCLACCEGGAQVVQAAGRVSAARAQADDAGGASSATHCPAHAPRGAVAESFHVSAEGASAHESSGASPSRVGEEEACCRRAGQVAEHARRPRVMGAPSGTPAVGFAPPVRAYAASEAATLAGTFIPDRGGTHARLCVFLI